MQFIYRGVWLSELAACKLVWGSVPRPLSLTQYASKSKVTELDDRVFCYQDVFRLYISVDALETNNKQTKKIHPRLEASISPGPRINNLFIQPHTPRKLCHEC